MKLGVVLLLLWVQTLSLAGLEFKALPSIPKDLIAPSLTRSRLPLFGHRERLSFLAPSLKVASSGKVSLNVSGQRFIHQTGMPLLPTVTRRIRVPRGSRAVVELENMVVAGSTTPQSLELAPEPFVWEPQHTLKFSHSVLGKYYPGKFLKYQQRGEFLHVQVFPVQYDLKTGKILKMTSADLVVSMETDPQTFETSPPSLYETLVVTSEKLKPLAEKLKTFHREELNTVTEIVTVESLRGTEALIEDTELPAGYKSVTDKTSPVVSYEPDTGKGYDYDSAKRIIHYTRARMGQGSRLKYVVLLGDATQVPPSYYFSVDTGYGISWGVTDACYGAKTGCMEPVLAVGRLPFTENAQLDTYLEKTSRWLKHSGRSSSELALYGGKAFPGEMYIGELGTLNLLNSEKVDWRGVQKFFRTRKSYDKANVLKMVKGETDASLLYYLDHGSGNQWWVEREFVSTREVLEHASPGRYPAPVVVSISCTNGAFDEGLVRQPLFQPSEHGDVAVGVALLRSQAGAVAYLGSARPALGSPIYHFDSQGNLSLEGTTYGLQYMDTFLSRYHTKGSGRLGDFLLEAAHDFLYENGNDMELAPNVYTYFNLVLLGDPTLQFPAREVKESNFGFSTSITQFAEGNGSGIPNLLVGEGEKAFIRFRSPAPVEATLIKRERDLTFQEAETIVQTLDAEGESELELGGVNSQGNYFLRIENANGVPLERQVWFRVQ